MASTFKIYDGQNWVDPCNCNVNVRTSSNTWKLLDPRNCLTKYWTGTEWCPIECPNPEQIGCGDGLIVVQGSSGAYYIPFTIPASAKGIKVHVDPSAARDAFQIVASDKTTWLAGLGSLGRSEFTSTTVNTGDPLKQSIFVSGSLNTDTFINQPNGSGGFIWGTDTPNNVNYNISGNWHTLEKLGPGVNSNYPNGGIIVNQFQPSIGNPCANLNDTYARVLVNRYIIPKSFIDTNAAKCRVHFTSEILPNQAPNTPFGGIILTEFSVDTSNFQQEIYSQPISRYYVPNNLNYSTNLTGYRVQNLTETLFGDLDTRSEYQLDQNGDIIGGNSKSLMLYKKITQQTEDVFIKVTGSICGNTGWYIPKIECFYDDYIEPTLQAAQLYVPQ